MAPCVSYELIAVRQADTRRDNRHWMPAVKSIKPIKRCLKKFKLVAPDKDATSPSL
jgi:hypothetical protein